MASCRCCWWRSSGSSAAHGLAAAVAALLFGLAGSWYLFAQHSLLVDPLAPLGAAFLTVFAASAFWYLASERERRYIREAFERYVSPAVLARIEKSPDALRLGGVNRTSPCCS